MASWISVHRLHRGAQLIVSEGEDPPDAGLRIRLNIQTYRLNQHHVSKVLCHKEAAGPLRAQFPAHAV
jgi:hypothetical protein